MHKPDSYITHIAPELLELGKKRGLTSEDYEKLIYVSETKFGPAFETLLLVGQIMKSNQEAEQNTSAKNTRETRALAPTEVARNNQSNQPGVKKKEGREDL